jgi:cytochrome c5
MNRFHSLNLRPQAITAVAAAVAISASAIVALAKNADGKPAKKKLTGAELYAINCNRCHAERYPTERTDAQWKTIMLHMRVRAQLPADDAKAILKYLQENN